MFSPIGKAPVGRLYAEEISSPVSDTGTNTSTRIDANTNDYDVSNGNELGWTDAQQRVFWLLKTTLGSVAADQTIGMKLPQKLGPNIDAEVSAAVKLALKPVIDDKTVKLVSVMTEVVSTRLFAVVNWLDLKRTNPQTTRVELSK